VNGLKLSVYFGEHDRAGHHTSAEAIARATVAAGVRTGILSRAIEGFGGRGEVHTERILTLSEDLPLVWTAVDSPEIITRLADTVGALIPQGLVTLERCGIAGATESPIGTDTEPVKLTVTIGRGHRTGGALSYLRIVDHLRECGVDGAYVLIGVDGLTHGIRHRARMIGTNASVPAQIVAIGARRDITRALVGLGTHGAPALVTTERIRVVKRDGTHLAPIDHAPQRDPDGYPVWQLLTLITREDAVGGGEALYMSAMRELRTHGARGATALAGVWGYSGTGTPHGDSMRRLRRAIPVICVCIDTPEAIVRLWPVVDHLTHTGGLVTSEIVPAFRTHGPVGSHGGLHLARPHRPGARS
jgi:PII-like signaling protein